MNKYSYLVIGNFLLLNSLPIGMDRLMFLNNEYRNLFSMVLPVAVLLFIAWNDSTEGTFKEKILRLLHPLDKIFLVFFYLTVISSLYNTYLFYSMSLYLVFVWYLFQSSLLLYAYFKNRPFIE